MKIFLDTARIDEVRTAVAHGFIDGVTTNPLLLGRAGTELEGFVREARELVEGPICVPVHAADTEAMIEEGRRLAQLDDGVMVKIPVDAAGLRAIAKLHAEGIRTHATLCCSATQALLAARAGADFLSPIIGRLEERGEPWMELLSQIIDIYDNYEFDTQIMVASVRSTAHVQESARLGADAVTMPMAVFAALSRHSLTEALQKDFLAEWKRS